LGVRGTEFIVSVPATDQVLSFAFKNIKLEDLPKLPTRAVLMEGAIDVSTSSGNKTNLTPGNTVDIDGSNNIKKYKTNNNDIDQHEQDISGRQGSSQGEKESLFDDKTSNQPQSHSGNDKNNNNNKNREDFEKDEHNQMPPTPPTSGNQNDLHGNRGQQHGGRDNDFRPDKKDIDNSIQSLGSRTDVKVNPSFVKP
jgi:hypothetical protein